MRALVCAAIGAVVAADVEVTLSPPFFLTTDGPSAPVLKTPAQLGDACAEYRNSATPSELYAAPDSQFAYETVCGARVLPPDGDPGPLRETCQNFGMLKPSAEITSVCELNRRLVEFLKCWGPGGLLTRLVEANAIDSHESFFSSLAEINSDYEEQIESGGNDRWRDCYESTEPIDPDRLQVAAKLIRILKEVVLAPLQNNLAPTAVTYAPEGEVMAVDPTFPPPAEPFMSDPAFTCDGSSAFLSLDPVVFNVTAPVDTDYVYLSLCAARTRARLLGTATTFPNEIEEVGCYYSPDEVYVPYVKMDESNTCVALAEVADGGLGFSGAGDWWVACTEAAIPVDSKRYYYEGTATSYTASDGDYSWEASRYKVVDGGSGIDVVIFECPSSSFPRGTRKADVCSTRYTDAELNRDAIAVTTVVRSGSETECLDACTLMSTCAGYKWTETLPGKCQLIVNTDADAAAIAEIPTLFPLLTTRASGALAVSTSTLPILTSIVEKRVDTAQSGAGYGPRLVYGQISRDRLGIPLGANIGVVRDTRAFRTPEHCGARCASTIGCRFAVWLNSQTPCYYYSAMVTTAFPAIDVFSNPGNCANVGAFLMNDTDLGAASRGAVCNAAPRCTWANELGCIDLYLPASGVYSAVPTTIPAVYAVPDPGSGGSGASWCPSGRICTSCNDEGCIDAEVIVYPDSVTEFTVENSAVCPNLRRAIVMSSSPVFGAGSFGRCPKLEKVEMGNVACLQDPSATGCTATFNPGALPTCAAPTENVGYVLNRADDAEGSDDEDGAEDEEGAGDTGILGYADATLNCFPCESDTAFYKPGRSVVPPEVVKVGPGVLADCPTVTRVSVPAATAFSNTLSKDSSTFWSTVLTALSVGSLPPDDTTTYTSTVRRCLMNHADTVGSFPHPSASSDIECLPCVSNVETGDLTIPWYVKSIPTRAFSECDIPGTIRFHTNDKGKGISSIASHAFDMTQGNRIGKVEIPSTLSGFRDGTITDAQSSGLGTHAFKAGGFDTFKVAFPRQSETSSEDIPDFILDKSFWTARVVTDNGEEPSTFCPLTGSITRSPASTKSFGGSSGCSPVTYSSPVKFDLLFGVCKCAFNAPGCFHTDAVNPAVTVPNATLPNCPQGRIGSVIIPIYPLFEPLGSTTLELTQYADDCVYSYDVVEPPGIHTEGCDICNADICVPGTTSVGSFRTEGRRGAKRVTTTAPDESVKVVPKDEDEPLSLPAVIAIVSIGSVSGLVILWVQFKKRLRWY